MGWVGFNVELELLCGLLLTFWNSSLRTTRRHAIPILIRHGGNGSFAMYSKSKKKRNTPIYFDTNYRTEMKLVPIIMDYCLLQFDILKFFLGVRLHGGGSQPNFNFFNVNPQIL